MSLDPFQVTELRREALQRATADLDVRPDVSALVREALAAWIRSRR